MVTVPDPSDRPRREPLSNLIAMTTEPLGLIERLGDVLGEVCGRAAAATNFPGTMRHGKPTSLHEAPAPSVSDLRLVDVLPEAEVHVKPVPAGMPFRDPQVGERLPTLGLTQATEELTNVTAQLVWIVTPVAPVCEGEKSIEPIRCAVPADPTLRPACRLRPRTFRIGGIAGRNVEACRPKRRHKLTHGLPRIGIQSEPPTRIGPHERRHRRHQDHHRN